MTALSSSNANVCDEDENKLLNRGIENEGSIVLGEKVRMNRVGLSVKKKAKRYVLHSKTKTETERSI